MVESWRDIRNILSILLVVAIITFSILSMKNKKWDLLIIFFWLLVPYLPVSHIFVTVGTLVAERTLYMPSIGFVLLAARFIIFVQNSTLYERAS